MPEEDVIDVEDWTTWPTRLRQCVEALAEPLRGTTIYTSDLELNDRAGDWVRVAMKGRPVRVYHSTRLLPHEVESVRSTGMAALSVDLVRRRLAGALAVGAITAEQFAALSAAAAFNDREWSVDNRSGRLCAVATRHTFADDAHGVWRLLSTWGGEAIYFPHDRTEVETALREIGIPSIVVLRIRPTREEPGSFYPALEKLLCGTVLALGDVSADVFWRRDVPAADIEAIWQPGDEQYDAYERLPR